MTDQNPEPETEAPTEEPTAEQRRAELPGLGYTGKFDHGEESLDQEETAEEQTAEDGEPNPDSPPSPSPATTQAPPPASQPWTLGSLREEA